MGLGGQRRGRPARLAVSAVAGVTAAVLALVGSVASMAGPVGGSPPGSGAGPAGSPSPGPGPAGPAGAPAVPAAMLALYRSAAPTCPGLPWQVLAGIGTVESSNGTSPLPGVHAGANAAGAEGPMQFEPSTFAAYALPVPPGGADPPSPYDPADAVFAAARMLCADGARGGSDLPGSVFAYNHSQGYVAEVFAVAASLGLP